MILQKATAKNRPSPYNEEDFIIAYKKVFPEAERDDNYDIAAVVSLYGTNGHAMMYYSYNRSRDGKYHEVRNFISDDELRYYMR